MASLASSSVKSITCRLVLLLTAVAASAQLSPDFYDNTCPTALSIIRRGVNDALDIEKRMGASLLRLHFHDCFVNGCDGSILLDDNSTFTGEKTAGPNNNSARGFDVIDSIKSEIESFCPGVVSCADILAVAARDSVVALGGPGWTVQLGRRDSLTANISAANSDIPSPFSNTSTLISNFAAKGLTATEMVALSGAHTIGKARCLLFRSRIYNETNIDLSFAVRREEDCPAESGSGDNNLAPLDFTTDNHFDNAYFIHLRRFRGLLHSDQQLYGQRASTDAVVLRYSLHFRTFFDHFADAMIEMGNISPLTGTDGEIRTNCRRVN